MFHSYSPSSVRTSFVFAVVLSTILSSNHFVHGQLSDKDIEGEIEETRNVFVLINGERLPTTLIDGGHAPRITVQVTFKKISYDLDLTLNVYLLSPSYVEKVITKDGPVYRRTNNTEEMCYYTGTVNGEEHSNAAFSSCEGIKGFFVINNTTFHVTPLVLDHSSIQGLYEINKVTNDSLSQWTCGTKDLKLQLDEGIRINQRIKRQIIRESLSGKSVMELYVANDRLRFRYFDGDHNKVTRSTKEIVNTANLLFQPVGFIVVLVGMEIWETDMMQIDRDSAVTLKNWQSYRRNKILNQHYNDVGFLISRQFFDGSVLGLAGLSTMCSSKLSGGIMTAIFDKSAVSGAILAHEIAHNFGVNHDTLDCQCESPSVSCIMAPRASTDRASQYFSSCSKKQLREAVAKGLDLCLKDFPHDLSQHYSVCGNGILERGEECDCGRMPAEECNSNCCNRTTCKLTESAKCASGGCCNLNTCELKQAAVECRPVVGGCDLPEFCDGRSAMCPMDVFKHDGLNCSVNGENSYCWKGQCRTQTTQCRELYGPSARESSSICYTTYNVLGDINGNCGYQIHEDMTFTRCEISNTMCGALQCSFSGTDLVRYTNFVYKTTKSIGSNVCNGVMLDYGDRAENPGMVPNGASCGSGMMCVSQRCVPSQSILQSNPCPECVHGVCNSNGRCHCDVGYGGVRCDDVGGPGGSPDSGPEGDQTATGLSAGAVVAIVLVLLLLIGVAVYLAYDCTHNGYIKRSLSVMSNKMASKATTSRPVYREDSAGQENKAYVSDLPQISVISTAVTSPTSRNIAPNAFNSYSPNAPHQTDWNRNIIKPNNPPPPRPTNLSSPPASKYTPVTPTAPHSPYTALTPPPTKWKPPAESHPTPSHPVPPSKNLKPKSNQPPPPPQGLKPKPTLPSLPTKPNIPPQVPPSSSKPKPGRAAPIAPNAAGNASSGSPENHVADVRSLKAKFESPSIA